MKLAGKVRKWKMQGAKKKDIMSAQWVPVDESMDGW